MKSFENYLAYQSGTGGNFFAQLANKEKLVRVNNNFYYNEFFHDIYRDLNDVEKFNTVNLNMIEEQYCADSEHIQLEMRRSAEFEEKILYMGHQLPFTVLLDQVCKIKNLFVLEHKENNDLKLWLSAMTSMKRYTNNDISIFARHGVSQMVTIKKNPTHVVPLLNRYLQDNFPIIQQGSLMYTLILKNIMMMPDRLTFLNTDHCSDWIKQTAYSFFFDESRGEHEDMEYGKKCKKLIDNNISTNIIKIKYIDFLYKYKVSNYSLWTHVPKHIFASYAIRHINIMNEMICLLPDNCEERTILKRMNEYLLSELNSHY
mgnify:CR=1 FL=1